MNEFEQLDDLMYAADVEALDALAARIDVEQRLQQLLRDVENLPKDNRDS